MSRPIIEPQLPQRKGYVEIEIDGVRQYRKIETEQDKQIAALTQQNADLSAAVDVLTIAALEG
ncbi:hypothetical protein IZU99_03105 [Oscillospiraceae bacterium CM]|nr:hypothetical protein IZU99_03105 [Oscillospiraceae bacterium CM]